MNTINPGGIRYDTELGPLFLDTLLDSPTVDLIVNQMRRQLLEPNDIVGCSIADGVVSFELREPLSND
jgi:hypothetical protein